MLYNGKNYQIGQLIDDMAGGSLSNKYCEGVEQLFENMASDESYWSAQGKPPKAASVIPSIVPNSAMHN